jgi:hypothetical protein
MQKIGGATITSAATISIEGATISISCKAKQRNHILGGASIFFGGATIGNAKKCKRLVAQHN